MRLERRIGDFSLVTKDVKLGKGVRIWHHCNLYGCSIGDNTQIGSYSEIKNGAKIGSNCRFQSYVFVPEGTVIGNKVFVGPQVSFANDKYPTAQKAIDGKWKLEPVIVEDEVIMGCRATILPGVRICEFAIIGQGAVVTKNVPAYAVVVGNPARVVGDRRDDKYKKLFPIK